MENGPNQKLLTGNEAIARAAYEAGVKVATAYPGTPSTEILENISGYREIYCQWSVNEKVAMEVASGASIAGARALVAMKHVGLNVAADPFMTLSYTGINGGLVVISADDPEMHSSQNEQDNRYYAKFAKVPMLEPSDSQEALDFVKRAFDISEQFDSPVLVRTTTRISHSRSIVSVGQKVVIAAKKYEKNAQKYVMIPAYARLRHAAVLERWKLLKAYCEKKENFMLYKPKGKNLSDDVGIITSGVTYQYAREVFYNIPILKLNMTSPLPAEAIKRFVTGKRLVLVIEELEPYLEEQIRLISPQTSIAGQQYFPDFGELNIKSMERVYDVLFGTEFFSGAQLNEKSAEWPLSQNNSSINVIDSDHATGESHRKKSKACGSAELPARPPVLCAGCPHRSVFYVLKKLKIAVMGDIGCYTLSVLPPLNTLDSTLCMGAGIGQALGMEKADPGLKNKVVSVIGDSTFFHSGITPMIDNAYNNGTGLIIVLDNGTTAMTGHQAHPGTGKTLMGSDVTGLKPEAFAAAAGIKNIKVVDPYNMKKLEAILKEELERKELSFVVCRRICALLEKDKKSENVFIDQHLCKQCGICLKFGCPAIEMKDGLYSINSLLCTGCEVCIDTCKWKAIQSIK